MSYTFGRTASAQTQGNEDYADVNGASAITIVDSGTVAMPGNFNRVFQFASAATRGELAYRVVPPNETPPTSNHFIYGAILRWTDVTPGTEYEFWWASDVDSAREWALVLETDGDIRLVDEAGSTVATATTPISVGKWYVFEARILPHETASEVQVWFKEFGTGTMADLFGGKQTGINGDADFNNYEHAHIGGPPASSGTMYYAGSYGFFNSTADADRLDSDFEVIGPYSIGQTGAAPDDDGGGTGGGGDSLDGDGALWQTTAEIPFSDEVQDTDAAEYAGTPLNGSCYTDGGTRGGPSGDSRIDGDSNIKGMSCIFRMERGNGGGTTHTLYFGNDADAGGSPGSHAQTLTTAPANYFVASDAAALAPLSTQNCRMGFGVSGAQNIYCHEMAAFLLHVPAGGQTISAGLATETDSAFGAVPERTYDVGLASDTETGFAVVPNRSRTIAAGLASETDTAFTLAKIIKTVLVGLASESDTGFPVVPERTYQVGLASEADTGQPVTFLKTRVVVVGQALETDTGFAVVPLRAYTFGQAQESDTGFAVQPDRTYSMGQAQEADTAFALTVRRALNLGLAAESDTGFAVVPLRTYLFGQGLETDTAFVVVPALGGGPTIIAVGQASESDTAFPVVPERAYTLGQALETDSAFVVVPLRAEQVGLASEGDTGFLVVPRRSVSVGAGPATETDTAFVLDKIIKGITTGLALETDSAFASPPERIYNLLQATEADVGQTLEKIIKTVQIGLAQETDFAQSLVGFAAQPTGFWVWPKRRR